MSSLLRSTKFVRYFTGAARTLILNTAKTAEANSLISAKAISAANNVLMRDYATKKKENLEPLLQKLDAEVRRFGRITKKDIDEVLDEIKSKNDITSSQSLLVIRCCGELVPEELPEQRTLLVQKIWSVLTERGIPMDISHYNALLRVYIENEHQFSPAKFLEELERKGLQPNRVTYQRLMWRYCQEGDVEGATKVLEKMRELSMPVSEPVLNALVMGHAFHGDTDGAKAVLETMAGAGLEPSNRTFTLLACGYAKKGDIEGIQATIKTANEKEALLTDRDVLEIIEHLAISGHGDKVEELIPHLQKGIGYNQDVCNVILRLLNKGQEQTAKKIMKTMPKSTTIEDTPFKGAFFVKQLLRLNKPADEVIETCRELQNEGLVPNAFFIATEGALQHGQAELAQKLFKELKKEGLEIRQHYYWPLLVAKGKENDEEGLLQILKEMSSDGITVTGEALRDYVIPFLIKRDTPQNVLTKLQIANVPAIHGARNLMVELLDEGNLKQAAEIAVMYRPWGNYSLVARSLIHAVTKTKDINSFATVLHVISSKPQTQAQAEEDSVQDEGQSEENNDLQEVSRIVRSSVKGLAKPDLAEKLLQAVYSKGLRITTATAESIEQFLGESMTTNLSQLLTKLSTSEMEPIPIESQRKPGGPRTTAQMETQLMQLKAKGANNLTRLQKQLLVAYIKENNVSKVNSFLEELKASDFELTTATLAQLFEFYCENDEIERADACKAQLAKKEPDFLLNKFKLVQMAFALIRANRFEDAVAYLKDNKQVDEAAGFMINSKCWQILNTLAERKNADQVKEMTKTLIDHKYVEPSNVILGPSIKVHLLNDDIEGALKEFENCCKQYRSTPWKGELMKALIMKEDATKLQWLADLSTQVHGEVNILHDLVLAFVECGRLRQARRILETPGLQTRHRRLDDACQRYVEEGKSEYLEGLLEATKELSHIDRSNIFYHLLITYCKAKETDKALGLWTLLQEEGEVPSDQFLSYLGKHLKSQNREVPFSIPEEKTKQTGKKQKGDVVEKIVTRREPSKPSKNDVSTHVETMTKDGQLSQAMDVAMKSIEHGVIPKTSVLKYLLKSLAEAGNVEKIQQLGKYINDSLKRRITYDDKLTLAVFTRGAGAQHIDSLLESVKSAKTEEELDSMLRKFPRSGALSTAIQDNELVAKCIEISNIAAEKGKFLPANLLWMELVLAGQDKEAEKIWTKWLSDAPVVVFRRLLQESHTRKEPEMIEKLITLLKTNKGLSLSSLGNAYSRLINFYVVENKLEAAEKTLSEALKVGLRTEHLNKSTIMRLKTLVEQSGKAFNYSV
ncbi:hypothetical protein PYW08_002031 [Mythimna loreyi]|uniref:Uncharacterized protein n=1 Tax=Mythimna loreyi TaxID=667449 RepID=A0ACC2R0U5_9NEOP|nr:hypothetical protein PYW08_002031 [Mythimna loreyi]